jgi:hypothetical protein
VKRFALPNDAAFVRESCIPVLFVLAFTRLFKVSSSLALVSLKPTGRKFPVSSIYDFGKMLSPFLYEAASRMEVNPPNRSRSLSNQFDFHRSRSTVVQVLVHP